MIHLGSSVIAPKDMLVAAGYKFEEVEDVITTAKNEVYSKYPFASSVEFYGTECQRLGLFDYSPIIYEFRRKTGREEVKLFKEKLIISTDLETGGFGGELLGAGMGQCLLSMKDMGDNNNGGFVYGFVTTGDSWRMLSYDGVLFRVTEKLHVMFETMGKDKDRWMKDYSLLVDCVYAALGKGGKDR
ncbi:hypothetical protein BGX38DRAFT_1328574 [Terfezia claveryi]|nr:hypothetical protein BGX38DRAFT_1328574 [Terfezia claveryi]